MRNVLFACLVISMLTCTGCATVAEALLTGMFESAFNSVTGRDDDCEIDPHILNRKGIEPGSKAHRRLEAHERFHKEFYEDFNKCD